MSSLPDRAARDRAATTADCNVVVTAGAGTGKTTLLVDRLVHLVLRQPAPLNIGDIVALTFTNKAAHDMKLRLRERLTRLQSLDPVDPPATPSARWEWEQLRAIQDRYGVTKDRIDELSAKALHELEKSQLGTIHSFAAHLLRLYPVESGVDPAFQEDDGARFQEHFEQAWALWLDGELGPEGCRHERWRQALQRMTLDELKALAMGLAGELTPLAQVVALEEETPPPPIRGWLRELALQAEDLRATHPQSNTIEAMLEAAALRLRQAAEEGGREEARDARLHRAVPPRTKMWSPEDYEQAKRLIKLAQTASEIAPAALAPVLRLLLPFAEHVRRTFVESGWLSFDGLLARARTLLRDHPRIRRELKGQFRAVLVDEFQDTDPVQYELILYLAEAPGREATDWRQIRLEPGKLFIVGDPKQSIYAFRRADMEAYDAVVEDLVLAQVPPGERHTLSTNFRSHAALLAPLNALFAAMFPREAIKGIQPRGEPLLAVATELAPLPGERVELRLVAPEEDDADGEAAGRAEAEELARWLAQEVLGRQELREREAPVKIKPGHVAILFRTLTNVRVYLEALRRFEIPYLTEGERHFYERQEVIDLVNLLRAIGDPDDRVALTGVLRSPLGALADGEIALLAQQRALDYRRALSSLVPNAALREKVQALYALLRALHEEVPRLPLPEIVDAVLAKVPVVELAAASRDGEQAVANLFKLGDMVRELAGRPELTLPGLVTLLRVRVRDLPGEAESRLAEDIPEEPGEQGAVRVLSIHKAKGLEFPLVILAGLHRGTDRRESRLLVQQDWSSGIVGVRAGDLQTLEGLYVGNKLAERQRAEQVRLLYVAMTRAKRRLVLSAGLPGPKSRNAESFLALLGKGMGIDVYQTESRTVPLGDGDIAIHVLQGGETYEGEVSPEPDRTDQEGEQRWRQADSDYAPLMARWEARRRRQETALQHRPLISVTALQAAANTHLELEENHRYRRQSRLALSPAEGAGLRQWEEGEDEAASYARLFGVLAHRVLEGWDFQGEADALSDRITETCRNAREGEGELSAQLEKDLCEMFQVFAASKIYAELRGGDILGCEVPFLMSIPSEGEGGRVVEGRIDLLYREKGSGQLWVADYKTDRIAEEEIVERVAAYRLQAQLYSDAVHRGLGHRPRLQLIFLRLGHAVEVGL